MGYHSSFPKVQLNGRSQTHFNHDQKFFLTRAMQFDNLGAQALGPSVPVTVPYDGLQFGGFSARNYDNPSNVFRANSRPAAASSNELRRILSGLPIANITAKYQGSRVRSFRLTSTFVGCGIPGAGIVPGAPAPPVAALPQPCRLLFSVVKANGQTASQTCSYAGLLLSPGMEECFFSEAFADAVTVNVEIDSVATLPLTTVVVLDNVVHTNNYTI
ncbi:MAG: hypothetical protein Q9213_004255 [Squamulea squamosa]